MSLDAAAWARAQRVGSQAAKHLLAAIAIYADEDGRCWPSRSKLADDTEMSVDTVDRRLRELEELGFIRREDRPCGPNGTPSRLIFLLFDIKRANADLAGNRTGKARKRELRETPAETDDDQRRGPQNAPPPSASSENSAQPGAATMRPHNEESLEESEESPSLALSTCSDPEAGAEGEREIADISRIREEFQKLQIAYGATGGMDLGRAIKEFGKHPVKARELMIRKAAVAREGRAASGRKHPKDLANWIADRDYELIAEQEQARAEAAGLPGPRVFVKEGTRAWDAWQSYLRETKDRRLGLAEQSLVQKGTGWWFPTLFPPPIPSYASAKA